ncbi:MAG TPA: hypothetical protein PK079_12885 [Leptospiraceae bacterium]|nr:hypothetical protein [Leptospiraceae bacterium]HMW04875.1 hypothetical protein [Leptospiraceae bacterium]HMX32558.1 hypothetical protein [Leptospiraceae bacterium]HMY30904.1 hypothetical protein [Leptospiraceae bacterium]HMZ62708.1 hypothetical protein [Leptospiraceae bacterium]
MYKKLFFVSVGLWILALIILGKFFILGNAHPSADGRKYIELSKEEKKFVLSEMRGLLTSFNGVLVGLSTNDKNRMIESARIAGTKGHNTSEGNHKTIMLKLPIEFKKMGMNLHKDFDLLAESIENGAEEKEIIQKLANLSGQCVQCHAGYRFSAE